MMFTEVTEISNLEVGKVYACVWREHEHKDRTVSLQYLRVEGVYPESNSGEAIKTDHGNRCFSRLRWFGPLPAKLDDAESLLPITPSTNQHSEREAKGMNKQNQIMGKPAITTTQICQMLGFVVSAQFIEDELGIPPDEKTKTANLWLESKFHYICYQLAQHVMGVQQDHMTGDIQPK